MTGERKIGIYRISIDGAMILAIITLIWHTAGWTEGVNNSVEGMERNYIYLSKKVAQLESGIPDADEIPLSREGERRLTALETGTASELRSINQRLTRIENKLDNLK